MTDPSESRRDGTRRYPRDFDPDRDVMLDARSLRGIAHPLRNELLGLLRKEGASTATKLATRLALSSAATSYHLRQLAEYGFVVEDQDRGTSRERWWKAAHRGTWFDRTALGSGDLDDDETDALADQYLRSVGHTYAENIRDWLADVGNQPVEWQDASNLSDSLLSLTLAETRELSDDLMAVVKRYRRHVPGEQPDDTERVQVQFQIMPQVRSDATGSAGADAEDAGGRP